MNKDVFDLFINKKDDFDLCNKIDALMEKRIEQAIGKENAKFYEVLRQLSNSINNAGWESRHSEQIALINKESYRISECYEDYLP